jgi:uncharacterized protein
MKQIFAAWLLLLSFSAFSQQKKIEIGIVDSLQSKVLNETRHIWVHVPEQPAYYGDYFTPKRYPVLYLLDGEWHFQSVTGLVHFLSSENSAGLIPEMIVVAIVNTNRTRDFTPTNAGKSWDGNENRALKRFSGGGENFLAFLEAELIPYIDAHYPTEPHRTLVGHSFGGLAVVNTLVEKPTLFNSYIAIDPSLWWDDQLVLKKASNAFQQNKIDGRKLFLALADSTLAIKQDPTSIAHVRANQALATLLDRQQKNGLEWKYYTGENHFTLALAATHDALRTLLEQQPLPIPANGVEATTFHANFVAAHYKSVSDKLGYQVPPPEELVYTLALACLNRGLPEKALAFLELNRTNYPQSFSVHDGLGDYYSKKGNKKKAMEHFTQALAIKDNPDTRDKLQTIKKRK